MRVLSDNDVLGAVAVLRSLLESAEWAEWVRGLDLEFLSFEDLGLAPDATDRAVWVAAQDAGAILITGNRSGGPESLELVLAELSDPMALPILTLADPRRIRRERDYARAAVVRLLDYLSQIEALRGSGRLYLP